MDSVRPKRLKKRQTGRVGAVEAEFFNGLLEILGKFNGRNHHALAVEYDMTENAIYKLLKRTQDRKFDRDQHKLDLGDGL